MLDPFVIDRLEKTAADIMCGVYAIAGFRDIADDIRKLLDEYARVTADNSHLRAEKALIWNHANTPLGTCHDIEK